MTHLHVPWLTLEHCLIISDPFTSVQACEGWQKHNAPRLVRQRMTANVHAPRLLLEGCL